MRRAAKSLVPRVPSILSHFEGAEAVCCSSARQFTSSAPACGIHIEEEVYNRYGPAKGDLYFIIYFYFYSAPTDIPPTTCIIPYRQRQIMHLGNRVVTLAPDSWCAPSAVLVGDVDLYEQVSIWHNCVLRGDLNTIKIGAFSNVQDRTVIHAARSSPTGLPAATIVGRSVTIGQACMLRSVTIEDECIVGDKCVLLEGSMMEKHSVLTAGSVLPPGRRVPTGQMWSGNPARYVRDLTKDEKAAIAPLAASVAPHVDAIKKEFMPETMAYRDAEELRAAMKVDAAVVVGADLDAVVQPIVEKIEY